VLLSWIGVDCTDDTAELGDAGNGGRSSIASLVGVLGLIDNRSILRFRTRSYKDGRAFRRGRKPMFIHTSHIGVSGGWFG